MNTNAAGEVVTAPGGADTDRMGLWLGWLIGAELLVGYLAPRTLAFSILPLVAFFLYAGYRRRIDIHIPPSFRLALIAVMAFFCLAVLSILWSPAPIEVLRKAVVVGAVALAVSVASGFVASEYPDVAQRLLRGVWLPTLIGAMLLGLDTITDGGLHKLVINTLHLPQHWFKSRFFEWQDGRLLKVDNVWINQSLAALVILVWPAALATTTIASNIWRRVAMGGLVVGTLAAVAGSNSQTAQLALLVAVLVAALAFLSSKWAQRMLMAGWVGACLLVVPLVLEAHNFGGEKSGWLETHLSHASPAVRIAIAYEYAKRIKEAPLFGRGANSSYVLGPRIDATRNPGVAAMGQHPHNAYLQVWFELGALGSALFAIAGLAILRAFGHLQAAARPYAFAMFAAVAAVLAPAYGMWQYWFCALLATSVVAFAIANRSQVGADATT
jgi:O-antigen ligase